MGYPMTWKRVVARNGLADGDYGTSPERWAARVNVQSREPLDPEMFTGVPKDKREAATLDSTQSLSNLRADRVVAYENAAKMLAGDLRRLELDALDERAVCIDIARRTAIEAEVVAAVLKEFFNV